MLIFAFYTNYMNIKLVKTEDNSHTLYVPELDEHYHSIHGAWQESKHVFIDAGFKQLGHLPTISVLEIGFGTGLNALLTSIENKCIQTITYVGVEKFPVPLEMVKQLNDSKTRAPSHSDLFLRMHASPWDQWNKLDASFNLYKAKEDLASYVTDTRFDLVYFDAFAPDKQPEMWHEENFRKFFKLMNLGGVLTTYCAKGVVRRLLQSIGYKVERIPGPPGKREMLRAIKV